ncbi:DUF6907 domain-containing protein [Streptomyces sp. NPDC058653]|uniref:DUF6907 domain-containing protein n=1 Tax=Streptomyces sp. NPDC058653 TaxID=3346576 RepID=UPI003665941F
MGKTVPNSIVAAVEAAEKPSPEIAEPATIPRPANRTLTYPLLGGGVLSAPCPSWCTADHESDVETGLYPAALQHTGDEISLDFTTEDGGTETILAARISQWPFDDECGDGKPHMELMPVGPGESLGYQTVSQVRETIARVRAHLTKLERQVDLLADATAEEHTSYHRSLDELGNISPSPRWVSLTAEDLRSMPVSYLLAAFEAKVVEVETLPDGYWGRLDRIDGQLEVKLLRSLTQAERASTVRNVLSDFAGGGRR